VSKVIVDGGGEMQIIMTRYNFGCVLFVERDNIKKK
jgi:hypothetical protein